jgi:hypothetical protein
MTEVFGYRAAMIGTPKVRSGIAMVLGAAALVAGGGLAAADETAGQALGTEKGTFGVGLIIGEPTGVSMKLYLSDDQAIDGAIGFTAVASGIHAHADYLFHPWIVEERDSFVIPVYLGPGIRLLERDRGRGADDGLQLGIRGVAGFLFDFTDIPLDVFAEVAVIGDLRFGTNDDDYNGFGVSLNAGIGARYYF